MDSAFVWYEMANDGAGDWCSIWTVDLAHLLRHFKVDVAFLTVTIGANPNFAIETFYKVISPSIVPMDFHWYSSYVNGLY